MLSDKLLKALNNQINKEIYSSYLYLAIAGHFETEGLKGFASWMKIQAQEELSHAMKFYEYIYDRDSQMEFLPIEAPAPKLGTPLEVLQIVLKHEESITKSIHDVYSLAREEGDYASESFLIWFINEQTEEEATLRDYIDSFKFVDGKTGVMLIDRKLGERTK
ncbi:ferritin [Treponema phagedenis]|uniref:ferritin n=1 Tax=Treponema phagedenis TaxID=162 RepID=UPI0001F642A3|nr:ferritin [Treponema phagedenis]EFW39020.1 ferritin-like protein [Treponema phagedenis F0421]QEK04947.1 ferritin [Treponema phagedenis]QEK10568.1 ferritin [Treponema phagedenis]TYT78891.1 ferritin [Treponema phagedenis]